MNSVLIPFILLTSTVSILSAQTYFGVKGNYSLSLNRSSTVKYDDAQDLLLYNVELTDEDILPSFGLFAYYRNDPIYIQTELHYRVTDLNFEVIDVLDFDNLRPQNFVKRTNEIIWPLHAGWQYYNLRFGAGTSLAFILSENEVFETLEFIEERRSSLEFSYTINFGIVYQRLLLELNYEWQTDGIADYFYFREDRKGFDQNNGIVNLSLGFLF